MGRTAKLLIAILVVALVGFAIIATALESDTSAQAIYERATAALADSYDHGGLFWASAYGDTRSDVKSRDGWIEVSGAFVSAGAQFWHLRRQSESETLEFRVVYEVRTQHWGPFDFLHRQTVRQTHMIFDAPNTGPSDVANAGAKGA